jgi:hypothetical protein
VSGPTGAAPDAGREPDLTSRTVGAAPGDDVRYPSFRVLAMKVLGVEVLALLLLWWLQHTFAV